MCKMNRKCLFNILKYNSFWYPVVHTGFETLSDARNQNLSLMAKISILLVYISLKIFIFRSELTRIGRRASGSSVVGLKL